MDSLSPLSEPTDQSFTDFYLTVEVARVNGKTGAQGLIFRKADGNYYVFQLCHNFEDYRFSVRYGGEWATLISCTSHSAIRPNGSNKLTVIAQGDDFTFLINEQHVDQWTDDRISKGSVGIAIQLYNEGDEATFEFDNFEVRKR